MPASLARLPKTSASVLAASCVAASLVTITGLGRAQTTQPSAPPPAQQPSAPPPAPSPQPPAAGQPPATPPPGDRPPPHYYVEPAQGSPTQTPAQPPSQPPPSGPPVHEPPPPGYGYAPAGSLVYEPPPPPLPRHIAPKYSFWVGARIGWFVPFGDLWARCTTPLGTNDCGSFEGVEFNDYASSGPVFELDIGARLGRNYNLFLLWEHAELGRGDLDPASDTLQRGEQDSANTDYYAIALRVSSDPDKVGFLTEIALGTRRFRTTWQNGAELQLTEAPFEARLGLGADIRMGPAFSLSPLITLGVGAFGEATHVAPDGNSVDATTDYDARSGHGWLTLQIGGHFDIGGGG
jgi:hypothetical protein